jgi:hypothetical protein
MINRIKQDMLHVSRLEKIKMMGELSEFALSTLTESIVEITGEANSINDDQKRAVKLDTYDESVSSCIDKTTTALDKLTVAYQVNKQIKLTSINNVKKWVQTFGIKEVDRQAKRTGDPHPPLYDTQATLSSFHNNDTNGGNGGNGGNDTNGGGSDLVVWNGALNRVAAPLVGSSAKSLNTNYINHSSKDITAGPISLNVPTINSVGDISNMSMRYYETYKVFVINLSGTSFTAGPGDFVDLKSRTTGLTKRAKRCRNNVPCPYTNCKYYHDPNTAGDRYNIHRNITISWVSTLLNKIKDDNDLVNNGDEYTTDYLLDLVQTAGIILYKASQIKQLYYPNGVY